MAHRGSRGSDRRRVKSDGSELQTGQENQTFICSQLVTRRLTQRLFFKISMKTLKLRPLLFWPIQIGVNWQLRGQTGIA